jgi:cell fate regulator YaaT (PSP1 superfamily)
MGCSTCANSRSKGCKNNGNCGTDGCNMMSTFDWLADMDGVSHTRHYTYEVRFKGGRKEFFRASPDLQIVTGDAVVVDTNGGYHVGYVSLSGELVGLQMKRKKVKDSEVRPILRLATEKDVEKLEEVKKREMPTMFRTREIIVGLGLNMKLSDVEYQADNNKATFYYSADKRVDFRELIKLLASEFKIRVEMRQISLRQEAGRLGGIGTCGRELCCSTWLSEFKSVSTSAARYQNISLNPSKLSGQCGRLKCCLNYELDTYMEALKDIPSVDGPLILKKGKAFLQKTDIFRKIMWFEVENETNWVALQVERVLEIQTLNQKNIYPEQISEDEVQQAVEAPMSHPLLDNKKKQNEKRNRKKGKRKNKR